jgi:adenylate cyclase
MRTENLAVMFTDIQGFTATTSRQTHEENARLLSRHDALLLPVVRAFGGRHVKSIGDAWLVVFRSPTNSVLCGMAIQDRLWDYNRRAAEPDRIRVRVAVNLGEVRVTRSFGSTDVFGEPVNIASRVEGEAAAGEVVFTEAVYLAMNKAEVAAEEVGYRQLKGVPEPVRLYRAGRGRYALAAEPPAEDGPEAPPYGNHALARVKGLAAPDPALLGRRSESPARLGALAGRARRAAGAALGRRSWWAAAAAVFAVAAAVAAIALFPSRAERLIADGRFDEARAAIAELQARRGDGDAEVLYLRGRLQEERWRRGEAGPREAFSLLGRALAAGSADARRELAREASAPECATRRLVAKALVDSRSKDAAQALRRLADDEPAAPEPENALETVKRIFAADGRCGAGDLAREGLRALEDAS